jgi:hypothetical protein
MRLGTQAPWLVAIASGLLACACASTPSIRPGPVDGAAPAGDGAAPNDGSSDDGPPLGFPDAGPGPDACNAPIAPCPSAAPEAGTPCATTVDCEYGADPTPSCNTIASCQKNQWTLFGGTDGGACPTTLPMGCPATYADATALVGTGATCAASAPCVYAEGTCSCDAVVGTPSVWRCSHASAGCPSARPRYGAACSAAGLSCGYGSGCYAPPLHESFAVTCLCGAWQGTPICQYP